MTSIRLETKRIEFEGKTWELRCNMAVLDALEQAHDGNFTEVMNLPPIKAIPEILAAMLNDYAEDQGWDVHYTPRQIARMVPFNTAKELDVVGMLFRAVIPPDASGETEAAPAGDDPGKN